MEAASSSSSSSVLTEHKELIAKNKKNEHERVVGVADGHDDNEAAAAAAAASTTTTTSSASNNNNNNKQQPQLSQVVENNSALERSVSHQDRLTAITITTDAVTMDTTPTNNLRTIVSPAAAAAPAAAVSASPHTPTMTTTPTTTASTATTTTAAAATAFDTASSVATDSSITTDLIYSDTEGATEASQQQHNHTHNHHNHHNHHHPPHMRATTTTTTTLIQADDARMMALNFVMEHKIFLQAALLLLQERDKQAPEVGMLDPFIFKAGPLKKAAHLMNGVWKVKYVEIRRGMFSYYENNVDTAAAAAAAAAAATTSTSTTTADTAGGSGGGGSSGGGGEHTKSTTATAAAAAAAAAVAAENQTLLLQRKNIPLTASTCTCRPVKLHQKALNFTPLGAIFELSVAGSKRLWMANSREERQTWMQAIHHAMVGGSVTRGYYDGMHDDDDDTRKRTTTITTTTPAATASATAAAPGSSSQSTTTMSTSNNKSDWSKYNKTQQLLRNAKTMTEYVAGLRELLLQQSLHVPVKWIVKQMNSSSSSISGGGSGGATISASSSGGGGGGGDGHRTPDGAATAFHEETIDMSVEQLWRDLQRDTVSIDGQVYRGDTGHGPERIVGALMRRILHVSRSNDSSSSSSSTGNNTAGLPKSPLVTLSESQALAVTRDVLLAGNRTRTGGDSYFCINALCRNPDLVVIVPNAQVADPVVFEVSEDQSDHSFHSRLISKSGWIKTRSRLNLSWKRRYFVLSEGTLSYYEGALPRPHGLRGQMFLKDAVLGLKRKENNDGLNQQVILSISVSEGSVKKERLLLFESEERLIDWIYALECTAKSRYNAEAKKSQKQKRGKDASEKTRNHISSFADIVTYAQLATFEHASTLGIHEDVVRARLERISRRTGSAVRISLRACTEYKICTTDPQGDEELDNWATIRTHFLQTFLATGGPNGRISRGEEMVRVSVVDCVAPPASEQQLHDPPMLTPRRPRNLRLFRGTSIEDPPPAAAAAAGENAAGVDANAEEQISEP